MNKYQKALNKLYHSSLMEYYYATECKEILQNIVDRTTPAKPIYNIEKKVHRCPVCRDYVNREDNYCSFCGQYLDWR